MVGRQWYDPYGGVRASNGALPTNRLYTGQQWDTALGLYDHRARWYDPALERFMSADTVVPVRKDRGVMPSMPCHKWTRRGSPKSDSVYALTATDSDCILVRLRYCSISCETCVTVH